MRTLSYVNGVGEIALLGQTIGENLKMTVERFPDNEAVVDCHHKVRLTYRELWRESERVAKGLMAFGVEKGDRVGIWAPNRYEWVLIQFATARIGAILVTVNPAYKTAELQYTLNQSGISVLMMSAGFRKTDYRAMISEVRDTAPQLQHVLILEDDWETLLLAADVISDDKLEKREETLQFDDPINIQYTSGTTGLPKGATLTHHNILNNGYFVGEKVRFSEKDRVCIPVPFYHCFGMVLGNLGCTTHGSCIVIADESFDADSVLRAVEAERCTALYGVPTMFIAELHHENLASFDLTSLRTGIMAGAPCPIEVMRAVETKLHIPEMTIAYGMTETSPVSTQTSVSDSLEKRVSTVGRVLPHIEVKVVDPMNGAVLPRGERGELCTRGYCVMRGYWNNPKATAEAVDEGGWMHTGDLAVIDNDGFVSIVGRIKDMIIRGGENISPREIEEFLHEHPDIKEVQVIGVPSEKYGEEVMAWLQLRGNAAISEEELVAYCKGKIATYKIPKYWKFVEQFPMTVTGKIQKYRMRQISTQELGLAHTSKIEN